MKALILALVIFAVGALLGASQARADVEFSTFGAGDTFYPNGGFYVSGSNNAISAPQTLVADAFTAGFTGTMTSVEVAVYENFGTSSATLYLAANNPATNLPTAGQLLTLGNITVANNVPGQIKTVTLAVPVALLSGGKYWLEMAPVTSTDFIVWNSANTATTTNVTSNNGGVTFTVYSGTTTAFRINATPGLTGVPEPATWVWMTLSVGAAGWCLAVRRRRRGA